MTPPLFIAVPVPCAIAARLATLGGGIPGGRQVPAENMHVTLRYLGETETMLADEICEALSTVSHPPFMLNVSGVGFFGKRRDPRLLYAGVRPHDELVSLHHKVEGLLAQLRIPPRERKYHPHITLARLKNASPWRIGDFVAANNLLESPPFGIRSFALYESHRRSDGSRYRMVREYALDDRAQGLRIAGPCP